MRTHKKEKPSARAEQLKKPLPGVQREKKSKYPGTKGYALGYLEGNILLKASKLKVPIYPVLNGEVKESLSAVVAKGYHGEVGSLR